MKKQPPLPGVLYPLRAATVIALLLTFQAPVLAQSPPAKLVAFWDFNDAGNTNRTLDKLHGYLGTLRGGAVYTADQGGRSGQAGDRAMDFGRTTAGQEVVVNNAGWLNALTAGDQLTVSLWIKHYQISDSSAFWLVSPSSAGSSRGFQAHVPWSDDTIYFDNSGTDRISANINTYSGWADDGFWTNWHHFAFVKNGTLKQIWIDGNMFLDGDLANPLPTDFTQIVIGAFVGGANNLHGQIDEFAVFGSALDSTAIGKLAQGVSPTSFDADTDNDGMPDWWEDDHGLNKNNASDAALDPDNDGLSNLQEYRRGTNPQNADTDGDGLKDGVETGTGVYVSANDTGTDPFNSDTDGDGLKDAVETGTGVFVSTSNTGTNPDKSDTDGDGFTDGIEVTLGSNPTDQSSIPIKSRAANLLAYWDFNDASVTDKAVDKMHGFVGSVEGGAVYTADQGGHTGKAGDHAMDFGPDSGGELVRVDSAAWVNAAAAVDKMTVSFWQNLVEIASSSAFWFVSDTDDRGFQAHVPWSDDTIYFDTAGVGGGWTRINAKINTFTNYVDDSFWTTWHHFAFVKNGKKKQIWIDGKLFVEGSGANPMPTDFTRFTIGAALDASGSIHGMIDDFAVFGSALDSSQIGALAQGTAPNTLDGDTDNDGMPDLWEAAHGLKPMDPSDASLDPDNDGLSNLQEYRKGTDPHNPDTDGDGLKDGVETGTGIWVSANDTGTDPTSADTDGDGLSDGVETATGVFVSASNTGTDPNKADTDGDGFPDGVEIALKSDPTSATSTPAKPGALNLLAYWNFDQASDPSNTVDVISGIVGSVENGAAYTADAGGHTGKPGDRAIDFGDASSKTGQLVHVRNGFLSAASVNDQISVSLWQILHDIAASSSFWGQSADPATGGRGINVHIPWSNNKIYYDTAGCCDGATQRIDADIATFAADPSFDFTARWHNFVFTKDGPIKQIWIDGQLFLQGTNTASFPSDFTDLFIGALNAAGGNSVDGIIDDFAVFAAALTPTEIGLIASGTAPNKLPARVVRPEVRIAPVAGKVTLSWTDTSFKLQKADKANGTYNDVTGATSPFDVTTTGSTEAYYRLAK